MGTTVPHSSVESHHSRESLGSGDRLCSRGNKGSKGTSGGESPGRLLVSQNDEAFGLWCLCLAVASWYHVTKLPEISSEIFFLGHPFVKAVQVFCLGCCREGGWICEVFDFCLATHPKLRNDISNTELFGKGCFYVRQGLISSFIYNCMKDFLHVPMLARKIRSLAVSGPQEEGPIKMGHSCRTSSPRLHILYNCARDTIDDLNNLRAVKLGVSVRAFHFLCAEARLHMGFLTNGGKPELVSMLVASGGSVRYGQDR